MITLKCNRQIAFTYDAINTIMKIWNNEISFIFSFLSWIFFLFISLSTWNWVNNSHVPISRNYSYCVNNKKISEIKKWIKYFMQWNYIYIYKNIKKRKSNHKKKFILINDLYTIRNNVHEKEQFFHKLE